MQILNVNYSATKLPTLSWSRLVGAFKKINRVYAGCFLLGYCILQLAYFFGQSLQQEFRVERDLLAVENRISLDLPRLSLPNPALNIAGNPAQVKDYLERLNRLLVQQHIPVRVIRLQQFNVSDITAAEQSGANGRVHAHEQLERILYLPGQTIHLTMGICEQSLWQHFSLYPLLTAVLLLLMLSPFMQPKITQDVTGSAAVAAADEALVLDLENKCLRFGAADTSVFLANKPLCFYAALLTYCQQHPGARLCQHGPLPEELLVLANQYFLRLVALGHTIRKRPDFDMNLEKTLSEIRAALDELLLAQPHRKALFYPPKALGEGSRSKVHNFALLHITDAHWAIKGK